jgi:TrkA domain protein
MEIERTTLPGIGLRHVFTTARGQRVGVVSYRNGRQDLIVYDPHDRDSVEHTLVFTAQEATALGDLLSTAHIVERLTELERRVQGITSAEVPIRPGSPYDGRPLADTQARTRTGASIVAVVRSGEVVPSPRPDFVFLAGDVVVVVGTADGTRAVSDILTDG